MISSAPPPKSDAPIYPGYPTVRFRLTNGEQVALPRGPWSMHDQLLPNADQTAQWRAHGFAIDALGRPLNPDFDRLIHEDGVITGRGNFYHFGPNFTADPVVIAGDGARKVLLIQRRDSGIWALPGGFRDEISRQSFADPDAPLDANLEPAVAAAARELREETGVELRAKDARFLGHLICDDPRNTAHAWAETDGFAWRIPEILPAVAGDDATDAAWFDLANLPDDLMTHHLKLIRRAETGENQMERLGKKFAITAENAPEFIADMGEWLREKLDGHGLVLGLSGGVDSAVVARLAQTAGVDLKVLLLPDGDKGKASDGFRDALTLAKKFNMNREIINIAPMCAAMKLPAEFASTTNAADKLLAQINIAPRVRAGILYQIAQLDGRRVVGTDNLAEQITGYFTKFGDGAYDLNPLTNCTKSEVYTLANSLGVIREIVAKPPSAGLFDDQTDEGEMGLSYADLDAWIMFGTCGDPETDAKIQARYEATAHKRRMPDGYIGLNKTSINFQGGSL